MSEGLLFSFQDHHLQSGNETRHRLLITTFQSLFPGLFSKLKKRALGPNPILQLLAVEKFQGRKLAILKFLCEIWGHAAQVSKLQKSSL